MRLTVILQDKITDWQEKGEIVKGYFNPAGRFEALDIILLNDDAPSIELLSFLAGEVPCRIFNLPLVSKEMMFLTLGWRPKLLRRKLDCLIEWLLVAPPDVVRAYETSLASYCGYVISEEIGCKYVVSLHSTFDKMALRSFSSFKDRLVRRFTKNVGCIGLGGASKIIAVYSTIVMKLPSSLSHKTLIIPNAVGVDVNDRKTSYSANKRINLVTSGRLVLGKSPEMIIRALALTEDVDLTVIGDGPLADELICVAEATGLSDRINFVKCMENKELCSKLSTFDAFVFRTEYLECPKTFIEAALVGLPIICSSDLQKRIPELQGLSLITCSDSVYGFSKAMDSIKNENLRQKYGKMLVEEAWELWSPSSCAEKMADVISKLK